MLICTIPLFVNNLLTEFRGTLDAHLRSYFVRRFQRIKLFPAMNEAIRKNVLIGRIVLCTMEDKIFT